MTHLHCMVDLETLDTKPSAVVLSIGAVLFDPNSDHIESRFYRVLNVTPQVKAGRTESEATKHWWAQQSQAAIDAVFNAKLKTQPADALVDFNNYLSMPGVRLEGVWGNGASFDNTIIRDLYDSFGVVAAWPFWLDRCFRTIKELKAPAGFQRPERKGTHHNALDDAEHQAVWMQGLVAAGARVII